jgi:uncharacterized protein YacL
MGGRAPSPARPPDGLVELLRLCLVVFAAGVGYQAARAVSPGTTALLGPLDASGVGLLVGSGVGYVLGGIASRSTLGAVQRAESALGSVGTEQLLGGSFGAVVGVLVGAGLSWPLFLVGQAWVSLPLFAFVVLTMGVLGYRVGSARWQSMLALFGSRVGLGVARPSPSSLPQVLDTSIAIDGRVLDVVRAGFLHGRVIVPRPVLDELVGLADAHDDARRAKGRRGLDVLEALRRQPGVDVVVTDDDAPDVPEVDAKLVRICLDHGYALLTVDTNLAKAAQLAGVDVLNLHALALAVRPPVTAGDEVSVLATKAGKEPGQAVGYLDDGTMVVIETARHLVGRELTVTITSVLTTANGRMVFARPVAEPSQVTGTGRQERS